MASFKKGQKVRIKKRELKEHDYRFSYVDAMTKYENEITEITEIKNGYSYLGKYKMPDDNYRYNLKIDDGKFNWSSGMLEAIPEEEEMQETTEEPKIIRGKIKEVITNDIPAYSKRMIDFLGDEITIDRETVIDGVKYYTVKENNIYWPEELINIIEDETD